MTIHANDITDFNLIADFSSLPVDEYMASLDETVCFSAGTISGIADEFIKSYSGVFHSAGG